MIAWYTLDAMKIGIFDSGLGGMLVARGLISGLPKYDYVYLGDTARVPYGNRSQDSIYQFTIEALNFLFQQNCKIVILACNTASAEALRKIQREYLPAHFPNRKVLGVLIPAAEAAVSRSHNKRFGILATSSTVYSEAFTREIKKLSPDAQVFQVAAPLLVPLIESGELEWVEPILEKYISPLIQQGVDTLVLGCTHYPFLKKEISKIVGPSISLVCQNEIIAEKLERYLVRHPEIQSELSQQSSRSFYVTDITKNMNYLVKKFFKHEAFLQHCSFD